jgi:hypothetical protein
MAENDFKIDIDNTDVQELFKIYYPEHMNNSYMPVTPLLNMISEDTRIVGRQISKGISKSDIGGFSVNTFGDASDFEEVQTNYTLKKLRHKIVLDQDTVDLSDRDEGAFKRAVLTTMERHRRALARHKSRMVFGAGNGLLGTISAVTSVSSVHTCTLSDFQRTKLVRREIVEIVAGGAKESATYKITDVDVANSQVELTQVSGASVTPTTAHTIYTQNAYHASDRNEWLGLQHILDATSGTLYGVTVDGRFQSTRLSGSSVAPNEDQLMQVFYDLADASGEFADVMVVNRVQMQFLNRIGLSEGLKRVEAKKPRFTLAIDVKSMNVGGVEVPILLDPHAPDDEIWMLNRDKMKIESTGVGSFEPGTKGFMHYLGAPNNAHEYALFWTQQSELWCNPLYQGQLHTLSSTL